LGLPKPVLKTFPKEFRKGMASRKCLLGDTGENDPDRWEEGWRPRDELHLMLTITARDRQVLRRRARRLKGRIRDTAGLRLVNEEKAGLIRHNKRGFAREHFGF